MNEIKKCSISGISFTLDKEAYARLEEYISSLKKAYDHNPDGAEIIADIEARIAELILSALSDAGQTVRKPLIENIIAQLGCAEDISGESADDEPIKSDTASAASLPRCRERQTRRCLRGTGQVFRCRYGVDSSRTVPSASGAYILRRLGGIDIRQSFRHVHYIIHHHVVRRSVG